jgi:anaphase-promoting complex subunit 6
MLKALSHVQQVKKSTLSSKWEPLLNNLGHTSRKLGKFEDALSYHQKALVLQPLSASTYSAIGYVQTLMTQYFEAVESFHKALSLRRDDAFSTTMLNNVVEHLVTDITPYHSKFSKCSTVCHFPENCLF